LNRGGSFAKTGVARRASKPTAVSLNSMASSKRVLQAA
jgi:hypothetical protein